MERSVLNVCTFYKLQYPIIKHKDMDGSGVVRVPMAQPVAGQGGSVTTRTTTTTTVYSSDEESDDGGGGWRANDQPSSDDDDGLPEMPPLAVTDLDAVEELLAPHRTSTPPHVDNVG